MANKRVRTASGRPFSEAPLTAVAIFQARAQRAGTLASGEWVRKTVLLLSQTGHGRRYRRPGGKTHVASAPGEVPARDDGNLVRSIGFEQVDRFTWRWGSGSLVALWLERGTRGRIKPRPWMQRSLSASGPAVKIAVRSAMAGD